MVDQMYSKIDPEELEPPATPEVETYDPSQIICPGCGEIDREYQELNIKYEIRAANIECKKCNTNYVITRRTVYAVYTDEAYREMCTDEERVLHDGWFAKYGWNRGDIA